MRRSIALITCSALLIGLPAMASGQGLLGGLVDRAKREAQREIEKAKQKAQKPITSAPSSAAPPSSTGTPSGPVRPIGPNATVRVGAVPQNLWLNVGRGKKFEAPEGKAQIIAVNPYLTPENFVFASLQGMDCLKDGSVIVSGEGWENADISGQGLWRIAADGAITNIAGSPWGEKTSLPVPYRFGATGDGGFVMVSYDAVYRVSDGRTRLIAGLNETEGYQDGSGTSARFKDSGHPLLDPAGNIWLTDQGGCVLRKIAPDGTVSTVIGEDRSGCGDLPANQRILLGAIAWDAVNGELAIGGSTITGKPHDLHAAVWRVKPDGSARQIFYTVKNGRSPVGQNTDGIWSIAVDPKGRIVVATREMKGQTRRQVMRVDEGAKRLVSLTGHSFRSDFGFDDYRPGREEDPYDGPAAKAQFREAKRMCYTPDGTLFVLDEHLVRRLNTDGTVRSWAY